MNHNEEIIMQSDDIIDVPVTAEQQAKLEELNAFIAKWMEDAEWIVAGTQASILCVVSYQNAEELSKGKVSNSTYANGDVPMMVRSLQHIAMDGNPMVGDLIAHTIQGLRIQARLVEEMTEMERLKN